MISIKDISKLLSPKRWRGIVRKRTLTNPFRDWMIVLGLVVLLNIMSASFAAYLFFATSEGDLFLRPSIEVGDVETINRQLLRETNERFELRALELSTLLENPLRTSDPSR